MPQKSPRGGAGAGKLNPHLQKKVETQEKHQAQDMLKQRSTELDAEIEAMEAKLTSGNAASAAELRESGQVSSSRILDSRSFFSKLKAKMMDNNVDTKGLHNILAPAGEDGSAASTTISLADMVTKLQIEVLVPISQEDQILLLQHYSNDTSDGGIRAGVLDVEKFMADTYEFCGGKEEAAAYESAKKEAEELQAVQDAPVIMAAEGEQMPIKETGLPGGPQITSKVKFSDAEKFGLERNHAQQHYKELFERSSDNVSSLEGLHSALRAEKEELGLEPSSGAGKGTSGGPAISIKPAIPEDYFGAASSTQTPSINPSNAGTISQPPVEKDKMKINLQPSDKEAAALRAAEEFDAFTVNVASQPAAGRGKESANLSLRKADTDAAFKGPAMSAADAADRMSGPNPKGSDSSPRPRTERPVPEAGPLSGSGAASSLSGREQALARENQRLKAELSSFDSEFWEQLEDMKYRYTSLQAAVGSDNLRDIHAKLAPAAGGGSGYTTAAPEGPSGPSFSTTAGSSTIGNNKNRVSLDSLEWNKRSATAAASSATLDSTLLQRPRYAAGNGVDAQLDMAAPVLRHPTGVHPAGTLYQAVEDKYAFGPNAGASQDAAIRGSMPVAGKGSVASMCERRLLFELGNHPDPDVAANTLVTRIMDLARKWGNAGRFVTVSMICDTMAGVGLRMKESEVRVFAAGFGSDGNGGIDAEELCEALQAILFNFIGEHEESLRGKNKYATALEEEEAINQQLHSYLDFHAGNILAHDKKGILGSGVSIYDTVAEPFQLADTAESGLLSYNRFSKVLRELGMTVDPDDDTIIKSYFSAGARGEGRGEDGEQNVDPNSRAGIKFRDQQMNGSLRGAAKADPRFGDYLASQHAGSGIDEALSGDTFVVYDDFCKELASAIDRVLSKQRAGEHKLTSMRQGTEEADAAASHQWVIREFDLVESLICQLELMTPSARRRALISLQYALLGGDAEGSGQTDGFGLVSALIGAGFQLQRLNRVHLLKCVEEMGGRIEYDDLFQILLRACSDWTKEERELVHRIIKAMGVTIQERRTWLGRVKAALRIAAMEYNEKLKVEAARKGGRGKGKTAGASAVGVSNSGEEGDSHEIGADAGIPPSAFLHILRDHGVILNVEQEATLLDCLDTEHLAGQGASNASSNSSAAKRARANALNNGNKKKAASWEMPLVYFKSFLSFCARHAGDWQDAIPDVTAVIEEAIASVGDPMKGLLELSTLFQAFDENKSGFVGNRAFQIVCHRARIFANISEKDIVALADTLLSEGGGKIKYTVFVFQLRNFASRLIAESNKAMLDIGGQLLTNATDSNNSLLPLRGWLAKHTDTGSLECRIGIKHFTAMLREFNVLYRPDDVRNLFIEIGSWADKNDDAQRRALVDGTDASIAPSDMKSKQAANLQQLNTADFLGYMFNLRGDWTAKHSTLCHRIVKSMQAVGVSVFVQGSNPPASTAQGSSSAATGAGRGGQDSSDMGFPKGPKGIETATARRIIARLRAFTGAPSADVTSNSNGSVEDEQEEKMIDLDVFGAICRATGLRLNDQDLLMLADATDRHPLANRINCDVLLDAVTAVTETKKEVEERRTAASTAEAGSDEKAAKFALKHLGDTLWNAGKRLKRKNKEWQNDVRSAMKGFDSQKVGYITTEDFQMALTLLNSQIDRAILRDIPVVPEGPGMVAYREVLDDIFSRSSTAAIADDEAPSNDGEGVSGKKKPLNLKGMSVAEQRKATLAAMEEEEKQKELAKEKASAAVNSLIKVIRKSMKKSLQETAAKAGHGKSTDMAADLKTRLNKAFKQFDAESAGVCSPRDFCLAVSILLDRDEVLLTENQWGEVITYFAPPQKGKKGSVDSEALGSAIPMVDYVRFTKLVMMEADPEAAPKKSARR